MDVRYFRFVFNEEEKVISEQLELDTVLEPALSRLGFVVDFEVFISRRKKIQLSKTRRRTEKEEKLARTRSGDDPGDRCASDLYPRIVHTHHDGLFLRTKDDIAQEVWVALWVQMPL